MLMQILALNSTMFHRVHVLKFYLCVCDGLGVKMLRRSIMRMGLVKHKHPNRPVPAGLSKLWKAAEEGPVDNLIIERLSPYQQKIVEPLFKDFGKKTVKRFTSNTVAISCGAFFYGLYLWSSYAYEQVLILIFCCCSFYVRGLL